MLLRSAKRASSNAGTPLTEKKARVAVKLATGTPPKARGTPKGKGKGTGRKKKAASSSESSEEDESGKEEEESEEEEQEESDEEEEQHKPAPKKPPPTQFQEPDANSLLDAFGF